MGQVKINSLRNEIELLREIVPDKVDVLMVSEYELHSFSRESQFYMELYPKPYQLDRSGKGRGIMLYAMEAVLTKLIKLICCKLDKEYF